MTSRIGVVLAATVVATASSAAVAADNAAVDGAAAPVELADVVVSASRISRNGFQQPTPVTVVGQEELTRAIPTTISNYLNLLPAFGRPTSTIAPFTGLAGSGQSLLNLRNLGVPRTLVLLDNRRVIGSPPIGGSSPVGVDINTLPMSLVDRVEVVTGGASAAWGADAVAGVVNFVLKKDFEGVEIDAQSGNTELGDYATNRLQISAGTNFADKRGRVIASAEYYSAPDILRARDRDYWKSEVLVTNPAFAAGNGQPRLIRVQSSGPSAETRGGLISGGPLRGTQFVGPTGTPTPFQFGTVYGTVRSGGDVDRYLGEVGHDLTTGLKYLTAFTHAEYDFTDQLTSYVELSYGNAVGTNDTLPYHRNGNISIPADNAFLDAATRARMSAAGIASFNFGKINSDWPLPSSRNEREMLRAVLGLRGQFGGKWNWEAYYQKGRNDAETRTAFNPIISRYNLAIDAVRDPASGQIVCRSTLTNPTNGCVPLNLFGNGVASAAATQYVAGTEAWTTGTSELDVVSANVQGDVASLPAGPVSVVLGGEYTKEKAVANADALSIARQFYAGNFQPFSGSRRVNELFGEVVIPVLKDSPLGRSLELNAAARVTDYNTTGTVTTWKAGLGWDVTEGFRVRATRSRDIRSPSLNDLYLKGSTGTQTIFDPKTGRSSLHLANSTGNPALDPESADTWTVGVVYRPSWLPGLGVSLDYYDIRIAGAIATLTSAQTLERCYAGETPLCDRIFRNAAGDITQINLVPTNVSLLTTSGYDFELSYRNELASGSLSTRLLLTYSGDNTTTGTTGIKQQIAGAVGADGGFGQPKVRAVLTSTFEKGNFAGTATIRGYGEAKLNNAWGPLDVDNNAVPKTAYLDLSAGYRIEGSRLDYRLTLAVENALDQAPRSVITSPTQLFYIQGTPGTRQDLYDVLGRSYRLGVKVSF